MIKTGARSVVMSLWWMLVLVVCVVAYLYFFRETLIEHIIKLGAALLLLFVICWLFNWVTDASSGVLEVFNNWTASPWPDTRNAIFWHAVAGILGYLGFGLIGVGLIYLPYLGYKWFTSGFSESRNRGSLPSRRPERVTYGPCGRIGSR